MHATTVEVISVQRGGVTARIDGRAPQKIAVGDLTSEGVYLKSVSAKGEAQLRIRGVDESVTAGRTIAASPNSAGLPSLQITANAEGKYIAQPTVLGQPFQLEITRQPLTLVIPVADADRIQLPYKDPPPPAPVEGEKPKKIKSQYPKPQKITRNDKTYYRHFTQIKSIRLGGVELFGVKAVVSEDPDLKMAVAGKSLLVMMDPTWEGSTLTVRRLP